MRAHDLRPAGRTGQPTRRLVAYVPPWLHEWVQAEARRRYPDAPAGGINGRIARLIRDLIAEAYERSGG